MRIIVRHKPASSCFDFNGAALQSSEVNILQPPYSHHLAAAKGWLELLAFDDASRELESIRPEHRDHSTVLEVRWALAANSGRWDEALAIAQSVARLVPSKPRGWIHQGSGGNGFRSEWPLVKTAIFLGMGGDWYAWVQ